MLKKTILTYYAVWYMAHKNSKHADDFGYFWFSALLMVGESIGAFVLMVFLTFSGLFGFHSFDYNIIYGTLLVPIPAMYYVIFKNYGINKNAEDESFDYLKINKRKVILSWCFFIGINLLMLVMAPYFRHLYILDKF